MSRTPARIRQADVARAIRAAQQTGAGAVEVLPDGTIRINLAGEKTQPPSELEQEVVL
jgi:acylphosphatase